jgi:alkanesulfonate monooxygenase SsuD/methylene tetrahydromethanopterin reductase-like flavin-dependent oxidoreductase (luciferase family)
MPVKFGVAVEAPVEWPELLALAQEIDRSSGYDYFWLTDALVANGPLDAPRLEAWTALGAIALATQRVRIGVMVSGNAYRHPALLAKMATTVDHVSGGRLDLGIGAGWPGENRRYGIEFWSRRERHERLGEALDVIKALWAEERPSYAGRYYTLDEPPYAPANVQQPRPPVFVGVAGSTHERMLRAVAKHADKTDAYEGRERVAEYARESGRDPQSIVLASETPFFMHDDPAAVARALEFAASQYGGEAEVRRHSIFGTPADVNDQVERRIDEGWSEIYLFQLPRVHVKSLLRFSDVIIRAFR